jgi:hypothetical protein
MKEIDSVSPPLWALYHLVNRRLGNDRKAAECFQKSWRLDPEYTKYADDIMKIYDKSGFIGIMRYWLDIESKKQNPNPIYMASIYLNSDKKEALDWLEKGYADHFPWIREIGHTFKDLWSESRFDELMKKMGLWDYYMNNQRH